ncbi:hypothetical protein B0H13DRAFT_2333106 [Mycena leptocephala]|nr:hypothetical protein B0H13DRAFT_2333106 [Mycena leptocephala]
MAMRFDVPRIQLSGVSHLRVSADIPNDLELIKVNFSNLFASLMAKILKLDQHLASRSYVEGYTSSQAGTTVFKAILSPSSAAQARHS